MDSEYNVQRSNEADMDKPIEYRAAAKRDVLSSILSIALLIMTGMVAAFGVILYSIWGDTVYVGKLYSYVVSSNKNGSFIMGPIIAVSLISSVVFLIVSFALSFIMVVRRKQKITNIITLCLSGTAIMVLIFLIFISAMVTIL